MTLWLSRYQTDVNIELKDEEAEVLKEMKENLECTKHSFTSTKDVISDFILKPMEQDPVFSLTVPQTFEDVAVTFSEEEWKMLSKADKDLHREVMVQNYETLVSVGYSILPEELSILIKADEEFWRYKVEEQRITQEKEHLVHYSNELSVPLKQLSLPLLIKAEEELPQGKAEDQSTRQQEHLEDNTASVRSSACRVCFSPSPSAETSQFHHRAEIFQPGMSSSSFHILSVPLLHTGHNCSKVSDNANCFSAEENSEIPHTMETPCKCSEYSNCFKQSWRLISQMTIDSADKSYNTLHYNDYGRCFAQPSSFKRHYSTHTLEKPYSMYFGDESALQKHQDVHSKVPHVCPVCGKIFNCRSKLRQHHMVHSGEKPFKCIVCDKSFARKDALTTHEKIHTGEKLYKCATCGKCFARKDRLTEHEKIHNGEKLFKCATCGKRFLKKGSLTEHEKIHTGEKLYKCAICGKSFARKANQRAHEQIHSEEKLYNCTTCGKSVARKDYLKVHEKIHSEKLCKCVTCGKSFARMCNLKVHEKIHTGENLYKCTTCGMSFARRDHFSQHEKTHIDDRKGKEAVLGALQMLRTALFANIKD